jgi:hypothetical protein
MDMVGSVKFGGSDVQNLINLNPPQSYDEFLAQSVTGLVNGADESAPAILYGGFGPFINIAVGHSFTIILPGVNSGNPVTVTVLVSDIVNISGNPVLTTSRVASMINTALGPFGVSTPVAENIKGQLVLTSADTLGRTYGDEAFVTITDVTIGTLTKLGFATSPSVSNGITAPRRGIITVSRDGLGGHVSLRRDDQTPAVTFNTALITFPAPLGYLRYTEEVPPAQPVYARLREFPGPHINGERFELSFFRKGFLRPSLITYRSDFSSLLAADTVTINIFDPVRGLNQNVPVTFSPVPTSPQNVVNLVNTQWNNRTFIDTGYMAGAATVKSELSGPYSFGISESFFISFQTTLPIQVTPGPSVVTVSELIASIQAAIVGAGAAVQGQAVQVIDPVTNQLKVVIKSLDTSGPGSTLTVYPGNPGGSSPAGYMVTLEKIGLVPGTFKGSSIAALYGNDEIVFSNPSHIENSSITITGLAPVMSKLGFSASPVSSVSTLGVEPTPAPFVHTLIPEMMELGEVPNGTDTIVQQFLSINDFPPINPLGGTSNFGSSPVIGPDGLIIPNIIPKHFPFMAVGQLDLGKQLTGSASDQLKPRVTASFNLSLGPTLLLETTSILGNNQVRTRLYQFGNTPGITIETWNATYDGTNYIKDVAGLISTRILKWEGSVIYSSRPDILNAPWTEFDWTSPVLVSPWDRSFGDPRIGTPLFSLGDPFHESLEQNVYVPRLQINLKDSTFSLVTQGLNLTATSTALRSYYFASTTGSSSIDTVNAYLDNLGNWNKDVPGIGAATTVLDDYSFFGLPSFRISLKEPGNDAPWTGWDSTPYFTYSSPTYLTKPLPTGAVNFMLSPLKAQSVRRGTPVPYVNILAAGPLSLVCVEGSDRFIFNIGVACLVNLIDMSTNLTYTIGDDFEVIISHTLAGAQVTPGPSAWGPSIIWENPNDGWLSDAVGSVDVYKFISLGFDSSLTSCILLGSVKRYFVF